ALAALEQTLERDPRLIEAQLYRGTVLERMQRPADAALAFLRAVRFAEANLDPQQMPPDLKRYLNHALGVVRAHLDAEIDRSLADLVAAHGADAVSRLRKAGDIFVGKRPPDFAHPKWRPGLMYVPDLPPKAFYERADFDWVSRVEAATEMVRAELMNVMTEGRGFAPYVNHPEGTREAQIWKSINQSYDWSTFHFYRHGERIEENCARCPGTAALL
ncbi:MAG: aspartyl/asparaginyl beta-hydroxylase domain-containing protein, partial [Xanthomonadales bacterium]|nr:aspartyl/asparaginyl beta-hydroxylase domain-containing protein [Xanthomonadales bacterium]